MYIQYRPPEKAKFIGYLDNSLNKSNISKIQEFYLMGNFNIINLLSGNKMLLDEKYYESYSQAPAVI